MRQTKENSIIKRCLEKRNSKDTEKVRQQMLIAAKIYETLKQKKITQREFAGMMGKSPSVISKWLSGTYSFTYGTLKEIQSVLNIEIVNRNMNNKECMPLV